jgi:hypothetical protein
MRALPVYEGGLCREPKSIFDRQIKLHTNIYGVTSLGRHHCPGTGA